MRAYYEKIEAPVDDVRSMTLYVVNTRDSEYEKTNPLTDTTHLVGVYEREDTAKAVVNAINNFQIWRTR
jgi:hypothetical protein